MPQHRYVRRPSELRRSRTLAAVAGAVVLTAAAGGAWLTPETARAEACTVAAAGDVAGPDDYLTGAAASAELVLEASPVAVLALGDLAYPDGTDEQFAAYYDPTWGQFKDITRPVPGNHEYNSGGGGYFRYFDVPSHYAFDVCGWRAVALNAEVDHATETAFLRSERRAHPDQPLLVYWHEPRWSSGSQTSGLPYQDLWQAAYDVGAELVLNGHDHNYERFAPMNAAGLPDPTGPREFVSGSGGHHPRTSFTTAPPPNSEKRVTGRPGILLLTLTSSSYSWVYRDTGGVQDSGTDSIVQSSGSPAPTATPTQTTTSPPTTTAPTMTEPPAPEKCLRNDNNSPLCRDLEPASG